MAKKSGIPTKISTEKSVPHNGFVIGSGNAKGGVSKAKAMHHEGIVIGEGSVTTKRPTTSPESINKLPSNRQDGRVL